MNNKIVYITRRERFNAAHKLWREDWTTEENAEIFGKCSNPNWHGHNYNLYVTVKGTVDPETGFLINLKHLSKILKVRIIDQLDHKNLNLDVDFLKGIMTSTELLCIAIWDEIVDDVNKLGCQLHSIKVAETENNSAEYFGE